MKYQIEYDILPGWNSRTITPSANITQSPGLSIIKPSAFRYICGCQVYTAQMRISLGVAQTITRIINTIHVYMTITEGTRV